MDLLPPYTPAAQALFELQQHGFVALGRGAVAKYLQVDPSALDSLTPGWNHLPPDRFLKDGGRYRRRRHGSWVVAGDRAHAVPHRAHWQPLDYNALHGGIERWFDPLDAAMVQQPVFQPLLTGFGRIASARWPAVAQWFVEVHPFRIDCTDGIGRPTPEGAHRDGVDLVVVLLVGRHAIRGGETRVFDATGPQGVRFTLTEPWSALLLDDARVIHESTPIQPARPGEPGWRDTLVLTYRRGGFQDPPAA